MDNSKKFIVMSAILVVFAIFMSLYTKNMNEENNVVSQNEGLQIEVLEEGSGEQVVKSGDTISVDYVGTLEDGTKFDSSIDRGQPFSTKIGVGDVIEGWDIGMLGMKIGEKRKLTIDSDLAYGDSGYPGVIPGGATLTFEVTLISID